jgi:hypothetical protein
MLNTDSVSADSIVRHGGEPAPPSACSVAEAVAGRAWGVAVQAIAGLPGCRLGFQT